jgi:heme A synthase
MRLRRLNDQLVGQSHPTTLRPTEEVEMQLHRHFAKCSIAPVSISTLAIAIGVLSAALGAPVGAIVLSEVCAFACLVAFTLLIWAAIQDGKQPDRIAAE